MSASEQPTQDNDGSGTEEKPPKLKKTFDEVFEEEMECVERRWKTVHGEDQTERKLFSKDENNEPRKPTTRNNLVGLAFSGGGIRSATINMGIAQALHKRGVFDHVDYMSTVSGGGYLGSSISTAMREFVEGEKGEFPYEYQDLETKARAAEAGEPVEVETKFLTWVRNNSNYMATGGFLDWPRIFGVLLRGILANFLVLLPILLVLAVGLVWWQGPMLARWEAQDQALAGLQKEADAAEARFQQAERRAAGGDAASREAADAAQRGAEKAAADVKAATAKMPSLGSFFPVALAFAGGFVLLALIFPVFIRAYKVYQHGKEEESSVESRGWVEMAFGLLLVGIVAAAVVELLPLLIRWFHHFETSGLRGLYTSAGSGGALGIFTAAGKFLSNLGGLKQKIALLLVGLLGLVIPLVGALYVADDLIYYHPPEQVETAEGAEPRTAGEAEGSSQAPAATRKAPKEPTPEYLLTPHQPMELTEPFRDRSFVRLLPGVLLLIFFGGLGAAGVGQLMKKASMLRALFSVVGIAIGAAVGYLVLVGLSIGLDWICRRLGADGIRPDLLVLGMAVVVFLFCWVAINVNLTGVLGLYRDRLAAAYLIGLKVPEAKKRKWYWPFGEEHPGGGDPEPFIEPDLNLEDLCGGIPDAATAAGGKAAGGESEPQGAVAVCKRSKAPYHIVNTALNLQGSSDPMLRDRGSDFFMFSKLNYGGHRTGYCETSRLEKIFPQMDLPTAMAISAAAASPNAGRMTNKPLVALMTLLNVRLGYWVPHPGRLYKWLQENEGATSKLGQRWRWRIPPWALLLEMRSKVSETGKWVNLSDGGHIENMAVYELLRRRCRYIICGDGEADPDLTFGGLATLMRSARIDMGIEIEILLDDLRLDENRKSHQHAALGRIKYPPSAADPEPEDSWLLYIKSSFTGNEDETMQEYRAKNADFPHETTADQFFDEGQFEAYRALGFHMADGLFQPGETKRNFADLDEWFRKLQTDLAPRLSARHMELRDQLRRISKLLRRQEFHDYFYQLYPDLDARTDEERAADREKQPGMPQITHLVGLQLDLMESAFLGLNLDQPANWRHPGNAGWRKLFESWAREPDPARKEKSTWFRDAYQFLGHRHSGRFQNFCQHTLGLPPLWEELERMTA